MTETTLPPVVAELQRLLEDDVTPDNVEQHIAEYEASLSQYFSPTEIQNTRLYRERYYQSVRAFAAYEVGGRSNGKTV